MDQYNLISFFGLFGLLFVAWIFSTDRRKFNSRCVIWGVIAQLVFGAFVFLVPFGTTMFLKLSDLVVKILQAGFEGVKFCFGPLATPPGQPGSLGFILITQGLPTIIFFAALMQVLYYLRVMPLLIKGFSRFFTRVMNVSGAESLSTAANIFVGVESATTVLPYLGTMTKSELCTILTGGMATIASSVMGLYVILLQSHFPNIAGHLVSASLLAAPAALVMSKLLLPETEIPETLGRVIEPHFEKDSSIMEAAIRGATAGGKLFVGVVVMLLALIGLVALVNAGLDVLGGFVNHRFGTEISLRLESLLAFVFYPFVLLVGVPAADAMEIARLLGIRAILTEIPAYQQLDVLISSGMLQHGRSAVLASYMLCGFAHIPSIAIFVGGTAALAPNQTQNLSRVAFRALAAATLACLMTAAIAGIFYGKGGLILNLK